MAKEVCFQRLEQPREWRSLGVARLTNMLCSLLYFFMMVAHKAVKLFSPEAEENSTAHSSW